MRFEEMKRRMERYEKTVRAGSFGGAGSMHADRLQ